MFWPTLIIKTITKIIPIEQGFRYFETFQRQVLIFKKIFLKSHFLAGRAFVLNSCWVRKRFEMNVRVEQMLGEHSRRIWKTMTIIFFPNYRFQVRIWGEKIFWNAFDRISTQIEKNEFCQILKRAVWQIWDVVER